MTEPIAHIIHIAILLAMIAASWLLPRTFGLFGLLAAHFCGVIGVVLIAYVTLVAGIGTDYEPLELIGYAIQGMIFNIAMLPLSVWAMFRWLRLSPMSRLYNPPVPPDAPLSETVDGG